VALILQITGDEVGLGLLSLGWLTSRAFSYFIHKANQNEINRNFISLTISENRKNLHYLKDFESCNVENSNERCAWTLGTVK